MGIIAVPNSSNIINYSSNNHVNHHGSTIIMVDELEAGAEEKPAEEAEVEARQDKALAKQIVKKYRNSVVRLALRDHDVSEFQKAADKYLPGLELNFSDLCPHPDLQVWTTLPAALTEIDWDLVHIWTFVRLTGLWPLAMFSGERSVGVLDSCPLCFLPNTSIDHLLRVCEFLPPLLLTVWTCKVLFPHWSEGCFLWHSFSFML